MGVLAFLVAISDLNEVRNAQFSPVNAAFMPVVVTGLWVLLAGIFFVKQLINPTADYPVIADPEPKTTVTEPEPAAEPGAAESPDADPDLTEDGETDADRADASPADVKWKAPVLLVAALVGYAFAIEPLGFVITTPLFFVAVTLIFGSRKYIRDVIVAILLTIGMHSLFTQLLELSLPQGVWPW